jgi:transcriptional regulator with XRE-family HTH domain
MSYSFAERIKKFMEIKELTQVPLAQKAGHSQSTINRAIHSTSIPRFDTLSNIAKALDVPVEALTYPDETVATIIFELSRMSKPDIKDVSEYVKKEKLWKHQLAAEKQETYK